MCETMYGNLKQGIKIQNQGNRYTPNGHISNLLEIVFASKVCILGLLILFFSAFLDPILYSS